MLWSLFLVNYKGASVRHSTAHPQNLPFCINGPTCPVNKRRSLNVSKVWQPFKGNVCLLSSGDSSKLMPKSFLEKYLHFYDNGQFKICWWGTINQKVHEPVLLWLTRELCAKQSLWLYLCFAPNTFNGSWIPFRAFVFASGIVDVRLVNLHCAEGWQMFCWHPPIWPRHLLYCNDIGSAFLHAVEEEWGCVEQGSPTGLSWVISDMLGSTQRWWFVLSSSRVMAQSNGFIQASYNAAVAVSIKFYLS